MPTLEIQRSLIVSTGHITAVTNDWLAEAVTGVTPITVDDLPYGYRVYTDIVDGVDYPAELLALLKLAACNDCAWIVLDSDGPGIDGCPTFDW